MTNNAATNTALQQRNTNPAQGHFNRHGVDELQGLPTHCLVLTFVGDLLAGQEQRSEVQHLSRYQQAAD